MAFRWSTSACPRSEYKERKEDLYINSVRSFAVCVCLCQGAFIHPLLPSLALFFSFLFLT